LGASATLHVPVFTDRDGTSWILSEEKVQSRRKTGRLFAGEGSFPGVPTYVAGSIHAVRKESVMKLGNFFRE